MIFFILSNVILLSIRYTDIYTNIPTVTISTLPLEERAGTWRFKDKDADIGTSGDTRIILDVVRRSLQVPDWRCHNGSELLVLEGALKSSISIDKITKFSVRPPELRVIDRVGDYFRWFISDGQRHKEDELSLMLKNNVYQSPWFDGLQCSVKIRYDC